MTVDKVNFMFVPGIKGAPAGHNKHFHASLSSNDKVLNIAEYVRHVHNVPPMMKCI